MGVVSPSTPHEFSEPAASERLDSWKEIAAYLKRDESTVRRWEEEGLPIHRLPHKKKATVYAFKSELDVWWSDGRSRLDAAVITGPTSSRGRLRWVAVGVTLLVVALALTVAERQRVFRGPRVGEIGSIAVLPLKNLSGDSGQDYFADGMTEALITELGKIGSLQVLSYQSVIRYRQTAESLPQIARELNVVAVLEGSVLRSENRVRITANLLQAAPERHLWAESFEFDPRDVLAVQREVAQEVARQTQVSLTPQERARLTTSQRVDPEAYEAYLLGRAYFYKARTATNSMRAKEYFEKAIAKDSGYAAAYASMAELYIWTSSGGTWMTDPNAKYREARLRAREWAEKALAVDDTLAEAHNALAMVKQVEWDWTGAEQEYRRAIELNPSYAMARISYAIHIYALQRFEEAAAQAERAQQLDPVSPFVNTWAGAAYFFAGRVEDARASLQRVLELEPSYSDASLVFARNYVSKAMYQEAIVELQTALTFNATEPFVLGALAHVYGRVGRVEDALKLVGELKRIEAERGNSPMSPFPFVWAYAGLGDKDQAFVWLERSYQQRRQRMVWLNVDPLLGPLRSDARLHDLVRRMGLPTNSPPPPG
ncbi:MAG: hypothetical protein DMD78_12550 [Candidatus Rokuibacteriota bacterium]|nr:MAG: hypothetical protein DMD78_12550 [Candidatus Rokubacteria bacterium]